MIQKCRSLWGCIFPSIGLYSIANEGAYYEHDEFFGSLLITTLVLLLSFLMNLVYSDHEGGNVSSHTAHLVSYFPLIKLFFHPVVILNCEISKYI